MTRLARVAALAVLVVALCTGLRVSAAPVINADAARLEPTRVFDPLSESLFASVGSRPHGMSLLAADLFNIAMPGAIAIRQDAQLLQPAASTALPSVNLSGITTIRAYNAPPRLVAATQPAASPIQAPALTPSYDAGNTFSGDIAVKAARPEAAVRAVTSVEIAPVRFGTYEPYTPSLESVQAGVTVPVRVGAVHFAGIMSGSQTQGSHGDAFGAMQRCGTTDEGSACPYLHDTSAESFAAGTNFNVRTGHSSVNVELSSSVARVSSGDAAIFPYVPMDPDTQFNSAQLEDPAGPQNSLLTYPGLTDVVKHGIDARVAVPVTRHITIGLQYNQTHYQGDYNNALLQTLDARKDTYLGNVTYQLGNSSSAITLSARQYRYQDTFAPNFNLTQTRADLDFTVKF